MAISIGSAIKEGAQVLNEAGVDEARRESGSLMAHAIGHDRAFIITNADRALDSGALEIFRKLVSRRSGGEPLQYITGHQEFFKLDFEVTPDVLIPRPETELLVEVALEILKNDPEPFFADIGTGSGCVAISLLHELPKARGLATDISPAALTVAERNAERLEVSNRLTLIQSDCFSGLETKGPFTLIASNPPYVSDDEMKALQREVKSEPRTALAAGADGLVIVKRLLDEAGRFLISGGHFVFEIGFGQSEALNQLIDRDTWEWLGIRKDLQGIPRTVVLRKR